MATLDRPPRPTRNALSDQWGITGLETAIVLIAFVVVASVFAFAVLSTGLVSTEKSKETVLAAHEEAAATMVLRGSVIGEKHLIFDRLDHIRFQVGTSVGGGAVNLTSR